MWQARKLANLTSSLSFEQALWVDARLAPHLVGMTFGRMMRFADGLVVEADPVAAQERHARQLDRRNVWIDPSVDGVAHLTGVLGAADARFLDATLDRMTGILATGGDTSTLGVLRSKALGLLATPARALQLLQADLLRELPDDLDTDCPALGQRGHTCGTITIDPDRLLPQAHIVVHLTDATARDGEGIARSDALGPVLAEWLEDLLGHTRVTVRPVLDQAGIVPADSYECPDRMREAVLLRSPSEAFPYSNRSSHGRGIDLDHTDPYDHEGDGGKPPPGQTRPDNLGPVSRPVHRAKTHGRWKVTQVASGYFLWTSPLDYHYLVTPSRTYPLDEPASPQVESHIEHALTKTLAQHTMRRPLPTVTIDF